MGSIVQEKRKTGSIAFRAKIRRHGKQIQKVFARKTDAKDWIKRVESDLVSGRTVPTLKKFTLGDAIERYQIEVLPLKRPATISLQTQHLNWFKRDIGNAKLNSLEANDLAQVRERLRQEDVVREGSKVCQKRSPSTVNRYFQALQHCLNTACASWGWMERVPRLKKLKEPSGRTRFLTPSEFKTIIEQLVADERHDVAIASYIGLLTGGRLNEVASLEWSDINLDSCTIHFRTTKTGKERYAPISPLLVERLKWWRTFKPNERFLFPAEEQTAKSEYARDKIRKVFTRTAAKLQLKGISFHCLRHTCASWSTQSGVNRKVLADLLGHAQVVTTDRYSHIYLEDLMPVTLAIENFLQPRPVTIEKCDG